jgi:nucleoside-diphosphate-sugar epimerase
LNENILVTGGTGFLGKHLIDKLLQDNNFVRVLDFRPMNDIPENWKNQVEYIQGDIRNVESIKLAVNGMDSVFHLAAIPSIAKERNDTYQDINVKGTRNVLKIAKDFGVKKALYISSSTVYGIPQKIPLTENDDLNPIGYYGKSKIEAEIIAQELSDSDFIVNIVRPRVILGGGRIGIFGILFNRILKNKRIYLIGGGQNYFQFTDVMDMTDACVLAINNNTPDIFNIGANEMGTVSEDIKSLVDYANSTSIITPLPTFIVRATLKFTGLFGVAPLMNEQFLIADKNFILDTKKAEKTLGWKPQKSNIETIIDAFEWYRNNIEEVKGQYKNLVGVLGKFQHSQQGAFQRSHD